MPDVVLYQPEIPPNTGNVIRLCANAGCGLHLVQPYGFRIDARSVRRAGLDYDDLASVEEHLDWDACRARLAGRRMFAISTRGTVRHTDAVFSPDDVFVFGPETRGLPGEMLEAFSPDRRLRIPMRSGNRSLNLANAVAIVVYEAWRQNGFAGSA